MAPWTEKDRRPYDPTPDAGRGPADFRAENGTDPDGQPRRDGGRPNDEARSKDELYEEAKRLKIDGRSRMSREELLSAIRLASVARIPR